MTASDDILEFWFSDRVRADWWGGNAALDEEISDRFLILYDEAQAGKYDNWANSPKGLLALVVLFDQFPRNMFRGRPEAYETDPLALALARFAVGKEIDRGMSVDYRHFLYMPFMHSEALDDQRARYGVGR